MTGIAYLSFLSNGITPVGPDLNYVYQGVSTDGQYYFSAEFDVRAKMPEYREPEDYSRYTDRMAVWLDKKPDLIIKPSLQKIDEWLMSIWVN